MPVPVAANSPRPLQNRHATTGDLGPTSTHHCKGPLADATRRKTSVGSTKATGDTLGRPPALQVATVNVIHGTIQSESSTPIVQTSRHAWVGCLGAAAISVTTVPPDAGRYRDSVAPDAAGRIGGRSGQTGSPPISSSISSAR